MSNDNTTNSFEELTFPFLLNKYDKILIPMIQRDYAQGRTTDKKAQEVRTNLLNDIFDEKKKCVHFDLIFGSCEKRNENDGEKRCFIPVDGQQRLTTLFLLYLYAQNVKRQKNDWDLSKFSYDTRRAAADFCKEVTATHWDVKSNEKVSDVIKNSVWFMNYWGNDPTVSGMLNMLDAIHEKANVEGTAFPNLDKVNFYFFDLESNGLNENLYLKMNSRGKPLTAFENLKASIEKILPNNIESDNPKKYFPENAASPKTFKDNWKFFMDRDWTNAFWNSEQPEVTDKNITAFIVRFLSGYYSAFCHSNEENEIAHKLKDFNNKNNYADFIPFEPIRKTLELQHAFQRLAIAFTTIVNREKIKPNWNETIETTDIHEYKTIAVVFAYVLFDGNSQAMRIAWNLAENTVSGYDNFIAYCKRIGEIFSCHEENEDDIYQILATKEFNNPSAQLIEEIAKAKQIVNGGRDWEFEIIEAERHKYLKGKIAALFNVDNKNEICLYDKIENFRSRYNLFLELADTEKESPFYFVKVLLSHCDKEKPWTNMDLSKIKACLNDDILIKCFRNITENKINESINEDWLKDLCTSEVMAKVGHYLKKGERSLFKNEGRRWNTFGNEIHNVKLGNNRNRILSNCYDGKIKSSSKESCRIYTDQKIENCQFFWGEHISFEYNNHCFQWWGNPNDKELDVYLLKENCDYCVKRNQTSNKNTNEDKYFCFRVTEDMSTEDFLIKLECLIQQACAEEAGRDCFNDCPNEKKNHIS